MSSGLTDMATKHALRVQNLTGVVSKRSHRKRENSLMWCKMQARYLMGAWWRLRVSCSFQQASRDD